MLNQTEPAALSILPCLAFLGDSVFSNLDYNSLLKIKPLSKLK
jgi:hypothetical protein